MTNHKTHQCCGIVRAARHEGTFPALIAVLALAALHVWVAAFGGGYRPNPVEVMAPWLGGQSATGAFRGGLLVSGGLLGAGSLVLARRPAIARLGMAPDLLRFFGVGALVAGGLGL